MAIQDLSGKVEDGLTSDDGGFALRVEDLVKIAQYIQVGLGMPQSRDDFRTKFPWDKLQKVFSQDPELYDGLATQLPVNFKECNNYATVIDPEIDNYSQSVVQLSSDANAAMELTYDKLKFVAAPESKITDPVVRNSVAEVVSTLDGLIPRFAQLKSLGADMVRQLSVFETDFNTSSEELTKLSGRWSQCVPSDSERQQQHDEMTKQAEILKQQAHDAMDQAREEAKRADTRSTYRWGLLVCGPIGIALLATDLLTGPTLDELNARAKKAQEDYDTLVGNWSEGDRLWSSSNILLHTLGDSVANVGASITGAILGLKQMMTAFSVLAVQFKALVSSMEDIEDDINEDDVHERLIAFEDIVKTKKAWSKIDKLANDFEAYRKLDKSWAKPGHGDGPRSRGDRLLREESLSKDECLVSANGRYRLVMQSDGNLVLYGPTGSMWHTDTWNRPNVKRVIMQWDGNLVIYDDKDQAYWSTDTMRGSPDVSLVVQDDGNTCVYHNGQPVWATNTWRGT